MPAATASTVETAAVRSAQHRLTDAESFRTQHWLEVVAFANDILIDTAKALLLTCALLLMHWAFHFGGKLGLPSLVTGVLEVAHNVSLVLVYFHLAYRFVVRIVRGN